MKILLKLI